MALLLLQRHCTVTIAHSRTPNLPAVAREADILCVAMGQPEMVTGEWIRPGAVVVDFGTTYTADGLKGDCEGAKRGCCGWDDDTCARWHRADDECNAAAESSGRLPTNYRHIEDSD